MHPKAHVPLIPTLINVTVTAVKTVSESWVVTCVPESVLVTQPAIINFQLIPPTLPNVKFMDSLEKHPSNRKQLSNPALSADGKTLTLSNINSERIDINVSLAFESGHDDKQWFDPQIRNEPRL